MSKIINQKIMKYLTAGYPCLGEVFYCTDCLSDILGE